MAARLGLSRDTARNSDGYSSCIAFQGVGASSAPTTRPQGPRWGRPCPGLLPGPVLGLGRWQHVSQATNPWPCQWGGLGSEQPSRSPLPFPKWDSTCFLSPDTSRALRQSPPGPAQPVLVLPASDRKGKEAFPGFVSFKMRIHRGVFSLLTRLIDR